MASEAARQHGVSPPAPPWPQTPRRSARHRFGAARGVPHPSSHWYSRVPVVRTPPAFLAARGWPERAVVKAYPGLQRLHSLHDRLPRCSVARAPPQAVVCTYGAPRAACITSRPHLRSSVGILLRLSSLQQIRRHETVARRQRLVAADIEQAHAQLERLAVC